MRRVPAEAWSFASTGGTETVMATVEDTGTRTIAEESGRERRRTRRANVRVEGGARERPRLGRGARHNVLVVGLNGRSLEYLESVAAFKSSKVAVVGLLDAAPRESCGELTQEQERCLACLDRLEIPHLGSLDRLLDILAGNPIDEVYITLPIKSFYDQIDELLAICDEAGVPVSLSTDLFERGRGRVCLVGGAHAQARLHYSCAQRRAWERFAKRAMDLAGAVFALTLLAIPMIVIAILIKLTSKGPVFFAQERLGMNHRPFRMLKFRTMVVNAEELKKELEAKNEMNGPVFKMRRDPRVTPVGRILRKLSLDELPQFLNVLKGDMSLVGPRPPIASEVERYEWWQRRRLSTRPGLTCFWQISGRNEIDFEDWMRLDLRYIDNWSLWLDVELILRTIPAVLRGRGAS